MIYAAKYTAKNAKNTAKKKKNFADIKIIHTFAVQYRGVEQLVARRAHNPEAGGSSPSPATKMPQLLSSKRVAALIQKECARFAPKIFSNLGGYPGCCRMPFKKNGHQRKIHVDFRWRGRWI